MIIFIHYFRVYLIHYNIIILLSPYCAIGRASGARDTSPRRQAASLCPRETGKANTHRRTRFRMLSEVYRHKSANSRWGQRQASDSGQSQTLWLRPEICVRRLWWTGGGLPQNKEPKSPKSLQRRSRWPVVTRPAGRPVWLRQEGERREMTSEKQTLVLWAESCPQKMLQSSPPVRVKVWFETGFWGGLS